MSMYLLVTSNYLNFDLTSSKILDNNFIGHFSKELKIFNNVINHLIITWLFFINHDQKNKTINNWKKKF